MNWYNYVGSDPINFTDPTGLMADDDECTPEDCILVEAEKPVSATELINRSGGGGGFSNRNLTNPYPRTFEEYLQGGLDALSNRLRELKDDIADTEDEAEKALRCAAESGRVHGLDLALDVAGVGAGALTIKFRAAGIVANSLVATAGITKGVIESDGLTTVTAVISKQSSSFQGLLPNSQVTNALRKTNNLLTGASLANNSIKAINTFNQCNKGR